MKRLLLVLVAVMLMGCAAPKVATDNVTVHTLVPANNTVYYSNGFGLVYYHNGKKYLAIFNQSSPFKNGSTVPADLTFSHGVLVKLKVGNNTYIPCKVMVEQKLFLWKEVYPVKNTTDS